MHPTPPSRPCQSACAPAKAVPRPASREQALCTLLGAGVLQPHLDHRTLACASRALADSYLGGRPKLERWSRLLATNLGVPTANVIEHAATLARLTDYSIQNMGHALDLIRAIKHDHPDAYPNALSNSRIDALATAMLAGQTNVSLAVAKADVVAFENLHGHHRRRLIAQLAWQNNIAAANALCLPLRVINHFERGCRTKPRGAWASICIAVAVNLTVLPTLLPLIAVANALSRMHIAVHLHPHDRARLRALKSPAIDLLRQRVSQKGVRPLLGT